MGVLVVGEQHQGGTVLPGFGGPFSVASQQDRTAAACFLLPKASLAGGDVLLVGAGSLRENSVHGQKMPKKERTHSFCTLYQSGIG